MNQTANKIFSRLLTNKWLVLLLCLALLGIIFPAKYAYGQTGYRCPGRSSIGCFPEGQQSLCNLQCRNMTVPPQDCVAGPKCERAEGLTGLGGILDVGAGIFTYIPALFIYVFLTLGALASFIAASFGAIALNHVLSPNFMPWPYTNPAANQIIRLGLNMTQPLANMILVLVLVFIALAVILRLAGYEIKKLLPTFILVALLVNFAPVITGLIVDASNIIFNAFAKNITFGDIMLGNLKAVGDVWLKLFKWSSFRITGQAEIVFQLVALTVVNVILFLILLLYAILFQARYVAIWALVILSPLAFVAYILPGTRKFANLWWNQFILWSIIGIPMMFFLYLAGELARLNPAASLPSGTIGGAILPSILPIIFAYLGFSLSLSISAMGAYTVINLTKRSGKWIGTKGWTGVKTWAEEKGGIREKVSTAVRAAERVPYARVFLPEVARKYAEFRPAVERGKEESNAYSSKVVAGRIAVGADYGVKAVGGMLTLIDRADMHDLFQAFKDKYKVKTEAELYNIPAFRDKMARLLQLGLRAGHHNTILRGDPRLARYGFDVLPGYGAADLEEIVGKGYGTPEGAVMKATLEARRAHIGHWEKEVTTDEQVIGAGMTKGTEFWSAIDTQVKQGQETALKTIDKMFTDFINSKGLAHAADPEINAAWDEWEKEFQAKFPGMKGYFEAVRTDRRFTARGWRRGNYVVPGAPPPGPGATPPPTTPGAAAGLVPPTPPRGAPGVGGP